VNSFVVVTYQNGLTDPYKSYSSVTGSASVNLDAQPQNLNMSVISVDTPQNSPPIFVVGETFEAEVASVWKSGLFPNFVLTVQSTGGVMLNGSVTLISNGACVGSSVSVSGSSVSLTCAQGLNSTGTILRFKVRGRVNTASTPFDFLILAIAQWQGSSTVFNISTSYSGVVYEPSVTLDNLQVVGGSCSALATTGNQVTFQVTLVQPSSLVSTAYSLRIPLSVLSPEFINFTGSQVQGDAIVLNVVGSGSVVLQFQAIVGSIIPGSPIPSRTLGLSYSSTIGTQAKNYSSSKTVLNGCGFAPLTATDALKTNLSSSTELPVNSSLMIPPNSMTCYQNATVDIVITLLAGRYPDASIQVSSVDSNSLLVLSVERLSIGSAITANNSGSDSLTFSLLDLKPGTDASRSVIVRVKV
jgi:hypothetical protein